MPKREQLEQMLQADPDDLFLKYALGMACISEGDTQTGLEKLTEVLQQDADYVPAYFQSGQALASQGAAEEAREMLRRGIAVAEQIGDQHAAREMTEFLGTL